MHSNGLKENSKNVSMYLCKYAEFQNQSTTEVFLQYKSTHINEE